MGEPDPQPRYPDQEGFVERDGVRLFYEVYGDGEPTFLLLPTWSLVHSRFWKAQIPYLARHHRVVTFDGRGNGRSDRPQDPRAYAPNEFAADALAVLDATGTDTAITVSLSAGTLWNLYLSRRHPERVVGRSLRRAAVPGRAANGRSGPGSRLLDRRRSVREAPSATTSTTSATTSREFAQWWAEQCALEPHSTMAIEYMVDWALETDGETIAHTLGPVEEAGGHSRCRRCSGPGSTPSSRWRGPISCPVLVLEGELDAVTPAELGRGARDGDGRPVPSCSPGTSHTVGRKPVPINLALRDFAQPDDREAQMPDPTVHRSDDGSKRALFVSSPIGLGHAQRDVAIARSSAPWSATSRSTGSRRIR